LLRLSSGCRRRLGIIGRDTTTGFPHYLEIGRRFISWREFSLEGKRGDWREKGLALEKGHKTD